MDLWENFCLDFLIKIGTYIFSHDRSLLVICKIQEIYEILNKVVGLEIRLGSVRLMIL